MLIIVLKYFVCQTLVCGISIQPKLVFATNCKFY